jgi:hypothetical protein
VPPKGVAVLQLPTPFEVGRAVAGIGRYHFGIPDEGLSVQAYFPASNGPYLQAVAPLTYKDVYIAPLADWLGWLAGSGWSDESVQLALRRLASWSRAAGLIALLGYLPVKVQIPALGGPVTFSPHGVIVLLGHFGPSSTTEVETWSCSMSYDIVGPDVGAMPNTIPEATLEDIFDAWATVITAADGGQFGAHIFLDGIAYYRRNASGQSTTGTWQRWISPTPAQGSSISGSNQGALQNAAVITFDAGGARGGRFGRIYLPSPCQPVTVGLWSSVVPTDLVDSAVTALTAVNLALTAAVTADVELVVASAIGDGENRPVRVVKAGRVPDTQRRRRRSLSESYVEQPFQSV